MKKILIIFPDKHLAYSPTVIQLYDKLSVSNKVTIIAPEPEGFTNQKLENRNVIYYKKKEISGFIRYFYRIYFEALVLLHGEIEYKKYRNNDYGFYFFVYRGIKNIIRKNRYYRIIAVDLDSLWICTLLRQKADFLSLELPNNTSILEHIHFNLVGNVIIQSQERFSYLFGDKKFNTFFIQNAPEFREMAIPAKRVSLLYNGTAWDMFGFYHCLDYLKNYPDEKLTVIGAVTEENKKRIAENYRDLIEQKRLIIDENYYDNNHLIEKLVQYEIGFCLYNFNISFINSFNYKTAPSGKMFKYLAAGIPVIANNITGFKFVNEFQCGILIDDLFPDTIRKAVMEVRANYDFYVHNAVAAAKNFSFEKSVTPYLENVLS